MEVARPVGVDVEDVLLTGDEASVDLSAVDAVAGEEKADQSYDGRIEPRFPADRDALINVDLLLLEQLINLNHVEVDLIVLHEREVRNVHCARNRHHRC